MFTTRPELTGDHGMVASTHWLASQTGMAILERGGNAFDAAVAAGFVLQVVEPHMNGPGGEVPILACPHDADAPTVIAGQGPAPRAATLERFRDLGLDLVPGTGQLCACVPGAFDAWMTLLARFGTLGVADVLEPAIGYAEHGYPLHPRVTETIASVARLFTDHWPTSAEVYLPGGAVPTAGSRFTNRALAATYRRIVAQARAAGPERERQIEAARDAFYRGFVAEAVDAFARREFVDVTGRAHAGLVTAGDLAGWRTPVEEPVSIDFGPYRVFKTGPWGQGPVFCQQLALLDGFDLSDTGPEDPRFLHVVTECAKLAFADREAYYGDPSMVDVPLAALLSRDYNARRRGLVGELASDELRPGSPDGRTPRLPDVPVVSRDPSDVGLGEPTTTDPLARATGDTCHLDVADSRGNLVAATPSGGWLQSTPVIGELGFGLGSRAQMFWLVDGMAAALAPGKRPRTTLSPSLAFRDGVPYMAFGTPGGDQQDQWSLLFFLRHAIFGTGLQEAIDAPAAHSAHFPSSFWPRGRSPNEMVVESRFDDHVLAELRHRGHLVTVAEPWSLGRLCAVARGADGFLHAAANPRGAQGYAVGR